MLTLAKTCERVDSIRVCERNRDWSILALQNIRWISRYLAISTISTEYLQYLQYLLLLIPCNLRTGKAHYLVICTCPDTGTLGRIENQPMLILTILYLQRVPSPRRAPRTHVCRVSACTGCCASCPAARSGGGSHVSSSPTPARPPPPPSRPCPSSCGTASSPAASRG